MFSLCTQTYDKVLYKLDSLTDNSNYQGDRTIMEIYYIKSSMTVVFIAQHLLKKRSIVYIHRKPF